MHFIKFLSDLDDSERVFFFENLLDGKRLLFRKPEFVIFCENLRQSQMLEYQLELHRDMRV